MGEGIFSSSLAPCSSCWLLLLLFYRIVVVGAEREVAGAGEACSSTAEAIHIEIEIEGGGEPAFLLEESRRICWVNI